MDIKDFAVYQCVKAVLGDLEPVDGVFKFRHGDVYFTRFEKLALEDYLSRHELVSSLQLKCILNEDFDL